MTVSKLVRIGIGKNRFEVNQFNHSTVSYVRIVKLIRIYALVSVTKVAGVRLG